LTATAFVALILLLAGAPALVGIVVRTKAVLAGRRGAPVLQLYYDLWKLAQKDVVYGATTGWIFRAAPVAVVVSLLFAALFVPLDGRAAVARFPGDMLAFAGLLGLGRFALVLAALDTGSSFEGMGASREVTIAAFAEPALFLCFVALVLASGSLSLSGMLGASLASVWSSAAAPLVLVGIALFILLLAENSRVPVDDPTTHLELTMIHEVMVLDHSGPDFALIQYAGGLRLALFVALVAAVLTPRGGFGAIGSLLALVIGSALIAVAIGVVESVMARLRLGRVPQLLVGAGALALIAIVLLMN
jgi:formate hydrogenlyase subunit 4